MADHIAGGITVRGQAEDRLDPTEAGLTATVHVRGHRTQADAVEACARRCEAVDAVVDAARGELVRRAVTSSVRTGPEWQHEPKGGRRLVGYTATRTSQLDCAPDGDGLTALLAEVAAMPDVTVDGPRWRVMPGSPGWDAVRTAAAEDARRRAVAYAEGLGVAIGGVRWIAEPGLRIPGTADGGFTRESMAFAAEAPGAYRRGGGVEDEPPAVVRVRPEPVAVSAALEVAFDLL